MSGGFASAASVALTLGGNRFTGWRSMKLAFGIEAAAAEMMLEMSDRWSDPGEVVPREVVPGMPFALALGGDEVMRGHLDEVEVVVSAREHVLNVAGRCPMGDLVDCAAMPDGPFEFAGVGLEEMARRLVAPFGLRGVIVQADCGAPFPRFAIQPGETVWECLERAARMRGVLVTGDGLGNLVIARGGAGGQGAGTVAMGENVVEGRHRFDWRRRHSEVIVRGMREGWPVQAEGIYATQPGGNTFALEEGGSAEGRSPFLSARARDVKVTRHRPKLIIAEGATSGQQGGVALQRRANWDVRVAAGRSAELHYTLPGWRGSAGALWRPNTLVLVRDAFIGLDREMLVASVTFILDPRRGSLTDLTLMPPAAFDLLAPEPQRGRRDRAERLMSGIQVSTDDGRTWRNETTRP